jgi:hypothetical protein
MGKTSIIEIKNFAEKSDCQLISTEYKNGKSINLEFICSCGNKMIASWDDFRYSPHCRDCGIEIRAKQRRHNINYVIEVSNSCGLKLIDNNYKNNSTKMNFVDNDEYKYFIPFSAVIASLRRGGNLEKVGKSNPYSIDNIKLWLLKNEKEYFLISTNFIGSSKNLLFVCSKCKNEFYSVWNRISSSKLKNNCPYCCNQKVYNKNCLGNIFPQLIVEWDFDKNFPLTPYDITAGSNKKLGWICSKCNRHWNASPNSRTGIFKNFGIIMGCKGCASKSIGEDRCYEVLLNIIEKNKIEKQYIFNDCRDILPLPFDLYLPDYNICIEYNGIQHYKPVEKFGGIKGLEIVKKHDMIKQKYCNDKNINFIEIPYFNFKDIQKILEDALQISSREGGLMPND